MAEVSEVFQLSGSESFAVAFGIPQIFGEGNEMFFAHGLFSERPICAKHWQAHMTRRISTAI
jgi:hypothetical protein